MKAKLLLMFCFLAMASTLVAQDALAEAEALAREGQYQASSEQLLAYIDAHPDRRYDVARAWWLHARNAFRLGNWSAAYSANQRSFNERRQLRSTDIVDNYLLFADLWLAEDDPQQALQAVDEGLHQLIENPVRYAQLYQLQGRAYAMLGEADLTDQAFRQAEAVLLIELGEHHPALGPLQYEWGQAARARGDIEQACQHWLAAYRLARDPWLRSRALLYLWAYHPLLK